MIDQFLMSSILTVVGGIAIIAIGLYWLYWIDRGITPSWFTNQTKRMPLRYQRIAAILFLVVGGCWAVVGLAAILVPALRPVLEPWL